mgnify:CR=1 FL=1
MSPKQNGSTAWTWPCSRKVSGPVSAAALGVLAPRAQPTSSAPPAAGPPAPPEDLWPQFGLLSWRSHRDAAADLPLEVEVRRSGGNRALPFSAELVVVRDEGQGGERLLRTPLRLDPDKPLLRVALRGDKAEVQ